jgi:hypothetical protein
VANCIFCGEPFGPDRERSKEHATPKWCRDLLPDRGVASHTQTVYTEAGVETVDQGRRDPFTTTLNDVCKPCNEGWMDELEKSSRSTLSNLIQGSPRRLGYWRQALVATWACKTAMVWECLAGDHRAMPMTCLRELHRTQRPPATHQVWFGRYAGDDPHSFRHAAGRTFGQPDPQQIHGYLVAIGIGQLVFVIFGHRFGHLEATPQNALAHRLVQIWPPIHEVAEWPPAQTLDDAGLSATVRALGTFPGVSLPYGPEIPEAATE